MIRYCWKCGNEVRHVETGFIMSIKLWWCDVCKDEVTPMVNKPPLWQSYKLPEEPDLEELPFPDFKGKLTFGGSDES